MAESTQIADYYVVDAFTAEPFSGNPAAVVILESKRDDDWMRRVAAEMNLSETAFVAKHLNAEGVRSLRWFTPAAEVDLCGHATLATARVLGGVQRFQTRSGILTCIPREDGTVEMDFPGDPVSPLPQELHEPLSKALPGVEVSLAVKGVSDILAMVPSAADLRSLQPHMDALAQLPVRGVIVTAPGGDAGADFVSRCFYPALGIPEDPATGSAHCTLANWWGERLGRDELVGMQLSQRGGVVGVRLSGDRVHLVGDAVIVAQGRLLY
jgi:predicted PhzF superfamily epimerase YddE/YHI9